MNRKVIVFGATGKTGSHICKALGSKDIPYTVFVRAESSKKIEKSAIEMKKGDVLNAQDVEQAFQQEDYTDVIISLGSKDLKSTKIRSIGTRNIIEAMTKNQSKANIHVVSALGIGESWNQLKWYAKLMVKVLIKNAMEDHKAQEDIVKNSPFPYHILRPVGLTDADASGEVHIQNEGYLPKDTIPRVDVAHFLVDSLLKGKTGISGICQK
jgi:nucleoside-diphosphate-sugar epimerase